MAALLSLVLPWAGLAAILGSIYYVWYRVFSYQGLPKTLSFATSDESFLSRGKASLGSVFRVNTLLWAGHQDVSLEMYSNT